MNRQEAKTYFYARIEELKDMCKPGGAETPWVFLCGSAMIDYLSRLAAGKDNGGKGFEKFIRDYMPSSYRDFEYRSGKRDLPEQVYYILRCGIVHSFSLIPDKQDKKRIGRRRSILLSHHDDHLSQVTLQKAPDACCLRADAFIGDIETAMSKLFADADNCSSLSLNIETWLKEYPPIMELVDEGHSQ